jgi:hypothetical protein
MGMSTSMSVSISKRITARRGPFSFGTWGLGFGLADIHSHR